MWTVDCGLRTADYAPRTWYKTQTRHKMRTTGFFIYLFLKTRLIISKALQWTCGQSTSVNLSQS